MMRAGWFAAVGHSLRSRYFSNRSGTADFGKRQSDSSRNGIANAER
jgi:hypothetical protein